jgi:hypothetical protein
MEDVDAPPVLNQATQSLVAATLLLRTMSKPSTTEGHRIHGEFRELLECAAVQQAKSYASRLREPASSHQVGPSRFERKTRYTLRLPTRMHPRRAIVSETTANPKRFTTASADTLDTTRRMATALDGRLLQQQGGSKPLPRAARSSGLQQGHSQSTVPASI